MKARHPARQRKAPSMTANAASHSRIQMTAETQHRQVADVATTYTGVSVGKRAVA